MAIIYLSVSFLKAFSFWNWFDALAVLLVLFGVTGGFIVSRRKYRPVEDLTDLMPASARKSRWEERKRCFEDAWEYVLILGLAMELCSFPHHLRETAEANERVAITEANNLLLRSNVLALEAVMQWRTITPAQESNIIRVLKPIVAAGQANPVDVFVHQMTDDEAMQFAKRLTEVVKNSGADASIPETGSYIYPGLVPHGLHLEQEGDGKKYSVFFGRLVESLKASGIDLTASVATVTNRPPTWRITVVVWPKPDR